MKRPDGGNPGRAIDLFGVGKDGFKDDPGDPPATQLDAAIVNNLVESLCVLVENSNQVLDGLNFDQVWLAVTNAVLTDPTIANGGTLTLEDASTLIVEINSAILLQSGGALQLQSGGVFQSVIGAIVQLLGSITIGTTAAQTMTVNSLSEFNENVTLAAAKDFILSAGSSIQSPTDGVVEAGTLALQIGAAAPSSDGEIAANADGLPTYQEAAGVRFVFGGVNGRWIGEDADQVPETSLSATTFLTTSSKTDVDGLLRIRLSGEVQRNSAGVLRISLEQDLGTSTWTVIDNGGVTVKDVTSVDTSDANDWTPIQIERTFGAGTTDTFFRLKLEGLGGATAKLRDSHLTIRRDGA